ncbi:YbhN family protein [Ihubacter sp. mB4P-1]|uniref:lysylphosphatidylglycerol synthase transmembrane domain-containing protein n=1 Tax=Ihubacter sp. mB4P-1 TaxID=3242370 RepID=UPI0013796B17
MKKALKNGGLFLALVCLTFYVIGKDLNLVQLRAALSSANSIWMVAAVLASAVFLCCEGTNIARLLRGFGCNCRLYQGIRYALTGFFFSSVTPSASGGQPMQLYAMHKDHVAISRGTLALLGELLSFQVVTVMLAMCGFLFQRQMILDTSKGLWWVFLIGVGVNLAVTAVLIMALLRPAIINTLMGLLVRLISRFSQRKGAQAEKFLSAQLTDYADSVFQLRQKPILMVKTFLTTLIQMTAMYSITYLTYRALGMQSFDFFQVVSLQAVLYVSVSALPLPGAVGVSEGGFLLLFQTLYPDGLLTGAMLLSRAASFYLPVLFSGLYAAVYFSRGMVDKTVKKVYS